MCCDGRNVIASAAAAAAAAAAAVARGSTVESQRANS